MNMHIGDAAEPDAAAAEHMEASIALPGEAAPPLVAEPDDRHIGPMTGEARLAPARFGDAVAAGFARGRRMWIGVATGSSGQHLPDLQAPHSEAPRSEPSTRGFALKADDLAQGGPLDDLDDIVLSPGPAHYPAPPAPARSWRQPAFIGAASVGAVCIAAAAAVIISTGNHAAAVNASEVGVELSGETGSGLMAPAAKLAMVPPREEALEPVSKLPTVSRKDLRKSSLDEVLSFKASAAAAGAGGEANAKTGAEDAVKPAAAVNEPAAAAPASNLMVSEVGVAEPPRSTVESAATAPPSPAPAASAPEAHRSAQAAAGLAADATRLGGSAAEPTGANGAKKHEDLAGQVRVASVKPGDGAAAGQGGVPAAGPAPARPPMTDAQQNEVLAYVTELATQLHDIRVEMTALQAGQQKLDGKVEAKLSDVERRVSMGEARRALDSVKLASLAPVEAAPPPLTVTPGPAAAKPNKSASKGIATANMTASAMAPVETPRRYRVQAASPGLAMLAEIDRSGDEGAQLQVAVGEQVPGYGRVLSIAQRGTAWVVKTDQGAIQ
jgi:hypothetical protein